jgi:hypothetical protein
VGHTPSITTPEPTPDALTVAVRVWTTRAAVSVGKAAEPDAGIEAGALVSERPVKRRYPTEALIFDTETEPGPAQRVRLLVWRLYSDAPGELAGYHCVEEGIAYPDDLPQRDPHGYRTLIEHARTFPADVAPGMGEPDSEGGLAIKSLSVWLEGRLYRYGYQHRNRCYVVGFNLPFDLGGLASHWGAATRRFRGGWTLGIWGNYDKDGKWQDRRYHPRLLMNAIDPRRTLFGWGSLKPGDADRRGPGRFIDLRTLAFALTDVSHALESACAAFGDPYEKDDVEHERSTPELIDYAVEDVRHTSLLYRHTLAELAEHCGIDLEPHRLYSPATVGARYLEAMGLERPLAKFTSLTPQQLGWTELDVEDDPVHQASEGHGVGEELLGYSMSAFYGGRTEARIVRAPVPVVHVDFRSMYPAVNALLGTWGLLRAASVRMIDVTEELRELLVDPRLLDRCLTPELWRQVGVTLVEIEPDGDILPVRATYNPNSPDLGIGVNPLTYGGKLWYALPDVIAAALLEGDKPPRVTRAIRMTGEGIQDGLRAVRLRGASELDPFAEQDPFLTMVMQRATVTANESIPSEERERLQLFLKITANATAYGSLARFDRRDLARPARVEVHGPDSDLRAGRTSTPEDPGPYCFPPVACSITAGARLMLAILERLITDAGGNYAFCDTDSMAIVATQNGGAVSCQTTEGESIRSLSWKTVRGILDQFATINPYDPQLLEPWKVEHDSLRQQLHCYVISAKRYVLYHQNPSGATEILTPHEGEQDPPEEDAPDPLTDWSEHGLGLYMDPAPREDPQEERWSWIGEAWGWILARELGIPREQPAWAERYALMRFTVSSPAVADWFSYLNESQHRGERVRPGSFGLIAHANPLFATDRKPTATYEKKPDLWPELAWYDRVTGQRVSVITARDRRDPESFARVQEDTVVVDALADVIGRYTRRPEHSSLAPNSQPASGKTHGLLLRLPVNAHPVTTLLTGKEGNKIIERLTGEVSDVGTYRNDHGWRMDRWELILPVLQDVGAPAIIARGIPRSTVYSTLRGARPREDESAYLALARTHAIAELERWGAEAPTDPVSQLASYLRERERQEVALRRCAWCGRPLPADVRADARYHSAACRKAAQRALPSADRKTSGPARTVGTDKP